ncbi:hypothetical protein RB195_007672 [Necator americanus]|uniref:Uncharacterized protein n=1 Tax=Necator americanus TaxID=51031 RepID=A0ABR1C1L5_NECAM
MEGAPPFSWIAHPVKVQLVNGGRERSVEGNLYTVDPVTGSIVVLQFHNEKPWQLSWIPREGYTSVQLLEESSPYCQQHSVELSDMMAHMFGMRKVDDFDVDELKQRFDRNPLLYRIENIRAGRIDECIICWKKNWDLVANVFCLG